MDDKKYQYLARFVLVFVFLPFFGFLTCIDDCTFIRNGDISVRRRSRFEATVRALCGASARCGTRSAETCSWKHEVCLCGVGFLLFSFYDICYCGIISQQLVLNVFFSVDFDVLLAQDLRTYFLYTFLLLIFYELLCFVSLICKNLMTYPEFIWVPTYFIFTAFFLSLNCFHYRFDIFILRILSFTSLMCKIDARSQKLGWGFS